VPRERIDRDRGISRSTLNDLEEGERMPPFPARRRDESKAVSAMRQKSAGILFFRRQGAEVEVMLVHPGGPFWRNRDAGAWQIPKGLIGAEEDARAAAVREAEEELGVRVSRCPMHLGKLQQKGGKLVEAYACEQDVDVAEVSSNLFELEWPPRSGIMQSFPEIDAARWFSLPGAAANILPSQRPLLDWLADLLDPEDTGLA
jgi:predicted NUDIX family NTP pyrophosphohydrolase